MTRVVAGIAGGRRLVTPSGHRTRPTGDRAREALFSTLESLRGSLSGASFLDLYAGSGAVGLEAASRGAARVLLVEHDRRALRALRANVDTLALAGVAVSTDPVERLLAAGPAAPFDITFLDPPYTDPVDRMLRLLLDNGWLTPSAVVVVERSSRDLRMPWPEGLVADRSRRYGDSTLWYGRRS